MTIKVYRTAKQVIHRLTMMREYAYISTKRSIRTSKAFCFIKLISAEGTTVNNYIYIGDRARSREVFDKKEFLMRIRKEFPSLSDDEISFPDVSELYKRTEGMVLEIDIEGDQLENVNNVWVYDYLHFDSEKEYLSDDYADVKISLSKIAGRSVRHKDEDPVPVDIAEFEVYDRMIDVLISTDESQHYGDGCCIEYSIISDGYEYRYFLVHFFSNHNWNIDPQNLLNICFSAELISGSCSRESVRFSHPSKITTRKSNGSEYLVEMITMDNSDVSVKFRNSKTEEPSEGDVAGLRFYDNPVDFTLWVDLYHQEIRMA